MAFGNRPPQNELSEHVAVPRGLQLEIAPGAQERYNRVAAALQWVRAARAAVATNGTRTMEQHPAVYPQYAGHLTANVVSTVPTEQSIIDRRLMYAAHDPVNENYNPVAEAERIAREAAVVAEAEQITRTAAAQQGITQAYGGNIPSQYQDGTPSYYAPVEASMTSPSVPAEVAFANQVYDETVALAQAQAFGHPAANPELDPALIRQEIDILHNADGARV